MFVPDTSRRYQPRYQLSSTVCYHHEKGLQQIGFHFEFDFVYKPKLIIMIPFPSFQPQLVRIAFQYLLDDNANREICTFRTN